MNPLSKDEISKAINKLKYNGKSSKTVSTTVLKDISNKLSEILMFLLNFCISEGYYPNELKGTAYFKGPFSLLLTLESLS